MTESLSLKWGTPKAWELETERSKELMQKYLDIGASMSAMAQKDTPEQKAIICDLIDAMDCDTVYLAWDGVDVSKDAAKKYVMEYGSKA